MKKIPLSARLEKMGSSWYNQLWICQQREEKKAWRACVCHGEQKWGG